MRFNSVLTFGTIVFSSLLLSACGGSSSSDDDNEIAETSVTYSTTSTRGDYSEWSLDGDDLSVVWQAVDDLGAIDVTYTIAATCATANEFGIRECTISTASCAPGASVCSDIPSGTFELMDVPGLAIFVNTDDVGVEKQLHVGFAKDAGACEDDVSGDYTFIRTGLGLSENFGMYRSDTNFINIAHSDFGFEPLSMFTAQEIAYRTGSASGMEVLNDMGCVEGVRTRDADGTLIRSMMTESGLFILDFPAGEGGLVSFKVDQAAVLADFAGKTFGGISFPDNGDPSPVLAEFGSVNAGRVEVTVGTETINLVDVEFDTSATITNPTYPDFTAVIPDYAGNALAATYPTPDTIPGLFKLEDPADSGRVILVGMNFNDKVIAFGMVYNRRDTTDTNPATGNPFDADGLYNTGNFIIFEM